MTEYLRPKGISGKLRELGRRRMEEGIFRNPPTYSVLGGFTSEAKLTNVSGHKDKTGGTTLERGGPSAQKGKPI